VEKHCGCAREAGSKPRPRRKRGRKKRIRGSGLSQDAFVGGGLIVERRIMKYLLKKGGDSQRGSPSKSDGTIKSTMGSEEQRGGSKNVPDGSHIPQDAKKALGWNEKKGKTAIPLSHVGGKYRIMKSADGTRSTPQVRRELQQK